MPELDQSSTAPSLKIENADYLITVDASRRVIQHGSLVIQGSRIAQVGKATDLASVPADRVIDATGGVVTPAFVNAHAHISYAHAVRGLFPDDAVGRPRLRQVFALQAAMTEEDEYATSLLAIIELLKNGTVLFVDPGTTRHLDACLQAYADAGCRIVTGTSVVDQPTDLGLPRFATDAALARTEAFIRTYDRRLHGRLRAWAMPFSPETCSPQLLAGSKRLADVYDTGLTFHHTGGGAVPGTPADPVPVSPTQRLEALGALGPNVLLAHARDLDDAEVEVIARTRTNVVVCPSTLLKEASGLGGHKLPELRARGVNVALGTDSANSSNFLDPVRVMHAAAVGVKDGRRDPRLVPAEEAVEMATLLGARALGLGDEVGSLEVGKQADLVVFDSRRAEWRALLNPVNNLVYSADGRSVSLVVADGRVVIEDGRPTFADERRVVDQVQALGEALLARTGHAVNRGRWPIV